jgi:hypothetical protein
MKHVTGEVINSLDEVSRQRRKANWLPWYQKSEKAKDFERKDLPDLAIQFRDFWDVTIPEDVRGRMPPRILNGVAKEIRRILQCCNRISSRTRQGPSTVDQQQVGVVSPLHKRQAPGNAKEEESAKKHCTMSLKGLPQSLTLNALRDGHLEELAAIEFAVHLLYTEKVSITVAADSFQNAGVRKPNSISLDDLDSGKEHCIKAWYETSQRRGRN